MSIAEIEAAIPRLSLEELHRIEQAVHLQYRERHDSVIYDDSYGVITEADLIASADRAFLIYDKEEQENAKRRPR